MGETNVAILGGGPAGCGAAYQLRRHQKGRVTLVEQREMLGGNAGSFDVKGIHLDYGSHRLHSACDPEILKDIQLLLGADLADRERHGRIFLRGKYVHFPLNAKDLLLRLDKSFAFGAGMDMIRRALSANGHQGETFASVLSANLGPTICEHFYFPYARKIWGLPPEALSAIQARKRVTAGSFAKLIKRLSNPPSKGRFYYPRHGYGQISKAYADEAARLGAEILTGWTAARIHRPDAGSDWTIEISRNGESRLLSAGHVWSTLPISVAIRLMTPEAPPEVLEAARQIQYRAMVLVYLELDWDQFTSTDAHYFPEENIRITRLSEPKNYFGSGEPRGRTILCAELPCFPESDDLWSMSDSEIAAIVVGDIRRAGLPLLRPPVNVFTRRLRQAYPVYTIGYEKLLAVLESWVESLPNFLTYGRQGIFAHDNTHHALFMAYSAVNCLKDGRFDWPQWKAYREIFATHVVED